VIIKARSIAKGTGSGRLLVSEAPISFLSGVDPASGIIIEEATPCRGSVSGRLSSHFLSGRDRRSGHTSSMP